MDRRLYQRININLDAAIYNKKTNVQNDCIVRNISENGLCIHFFNNNFNGGIELHDTVIIQMVDGDKVLTVQGLVVRTLFPDKDNNLEIGVKVPYNDIWDKYVQKKKANRYINALLSTRLHQA